MARWVICLFVSSLLQIVQTVGARQRLMNAQLAKLHPDPILYLQKSMLTKIKLFEQRIKFLEVADQSSHQGRK